MKFLKLKSILFSLVAIVMVTVFLTSCEKKIISNEEEVENAQKIQPDDDVFLLDLPEETSGMSNEEFLGFLENVPEDGMSKYKTDTKINDGLELRGCDGYGDSWLYVGSECWYSPNCSSSQKVYIYKKKCIKDWAFDTWIYGYVWSNYCC